MAAQTLHNEPASRLRRTFPVAFTLVAGITLTLLAFKILRDMEHERVALDFEAIALNQTRSLNEKIHEYEESLHMLRNLLIASEHVSSDEFELVCQDLRTRQSGIHALRWLPFVPSANRAATERDARTTIDPNWTIHDGDGGPGSEVQDTDSRMHFLPVLYVSPRSDNSMALGSDQLVGSHQHAIQRAIDTGMISATRRVPLQGRSAPEFGWIIYLAVYEKGTISESAGQRWKKLQGVLQGDFRLSDLLNGNSVDYSQALQLVLADETPGSSEPYLLNFSRGKMGTAPPPQPDDFQHPMTLKYAIASSGRLWKLYAQPDPMWLATKRTGMPYVILVFGTWLTAFLAASIHSTRRRTETVSRLVETQTAQLRDVEGQLREDVAIRKQAEERYQAFVQQSTEAIWRFEMDEPMPLDWSEESQVEFIHQRAYLAECNDACARMYGYDRSDEMIGMRLRDLMPLDDPRNREHLHSYVQSGFRLLDSESYEFDRFGNEHVFVNNAIGIIEDGKFVRGWGTQRDITEQRRLEQERIAAAERLRLAIEAVHLGLWEWDPIADKLTWNDELLEMYGLSREAFAGNYEAFAKAIHPVDRERVENAVKRALEDPHGKFECEYRVIRPDGTERWIYSRGHVRRDAAGTAIGMLGAAIDITNRKQAETEHAAMEQKLQETQKLESLGILAGGIAHDFNNLLTGVLGNASLARMDLPSASHVQPYLKQIEHSAQRAADLCRQMLAYSGKGRFIVQRVSLSHLVEECVALLQISISKDATLKLSLTDPLPPVQADATQLRQILMNLVMNASDAIGNRPGFIHIKTGVIEADSAYLAKTYLSPVLPGGLYVYLEVRDTGTGMDAETQKRIFDPFFTTKFTGRGLGLAAALGIVRSHQGALKVVSELGRGSAFTLFLPKAEGALDELSFPPTAESDWSGEGRVLVIDDEETVRRVSAQMLKSMGFDTVAAVDGQQGLALFTAHPKAFTAVLLDLTMPKMDGAETFAKLKKLDPHIPVILMSGYTEQEAASQIGSRDMAGFVQKPFQREQFQEILRCALDARD
jgi:PAS domain S-box-containing protein